jgi:hypothetical protein
VGAAPAGADVAVAAGLSSVVLEQPLNTNADRQTSARILVRTTVHPFIMARAALMVTTPKRPHPDTAPPKKPVHVRSMTRGAVQRVEY